MALRPGPGESAPPPPLPRHLPDGDARPSPGRADDGRLPGRHHPALEGAGAGAAQPPQQRSGEVPQRRVGQLGAQEAEVAQRQGQQAHAHRPLPHRGGRRLLLRRRLPRHVRGGTPVAGALLTPPP